MSDVGIDSKEALLLLYTIYFGVLSMWIKCPMLKFFSWPHGFDSKCKSVPVDPRAQEK